MHCRRRNRGRSPWRSGSDQRAGHKAGGSKRNDLMLEHVPRKVEKHRGRWTGQGTGQSARSGKNRPAGFTRSYAAAESLHEAIADPNFGNPGPASRIGCCNQTNPPSGWAGTACEDRESRKLPEFPEFPKIDVESEYF